MDLKEFGQRLTKIRQSKGMSAYELSFRIEKDPNYIHKVKNAKMNISLASLFTICKELDVTPEDLFTA